MSENLEVNKENLENSAIEEKSEDVGNSTEVKHSLRSNLYDKIDIPVKTMDKIIAGLIILIVFFVIVGIIQGIS